MGDALTPDVQAMVLELADLAAPLVQSTPDTWDGAVRQAADRIEALALDDAHALLLAALVALAGSAR